MRDDARERPVDLAAAARNPSGRGDWRVVEGGAALNDVRPLFDERLIAIEAAPADGLVRGRFVARGRGAWGLLVRATNTDGDVLSGYVFTIDDGEAYWLRFSAGVGRRISPSVRVGAIERLELTVTMFGPHLTGVVANAADQRVAAVVLTSEPGFARGAFGVWVDARRRGPIVEHLAFDDGTRAGRLPPGGTVDRRVADGRVLDGPAFEQRRRASLSAAPADEGDIEVPRGLGDAGFNAMIAARARGERPARGGVTYRDAAEVLRILDDVAAEHPRSTRVLEMGATRGGRPMRALVIDDPAGPPHKPTIMMTGGLHGNEPMAVLHALNAVEALLETGPRARAARRAFRFVVVPTANPDGTDAYLYLSRFAGRKNGADGNGDGRLEPWEGVDLNRNHPTAFGALDERGSRTLPHHPFYRGPAPASEPETRALLALADDERPWAAIDWHTAAGAVLVPYTIEGLADPRPNEALFVAERMIAAAGVQANGRPFALKRMLYPVDGTHHDALRHRYGTLAFLVEGALHDPPPERRADDLRRAQPVLWGLIEALNGPAIEVTACDGRGQPLEVAVTIDELPVSAGETWTTRPRDGRFFRRVPAPGRYTVRAARAPDIRIAAVTVGRGRTVVPFVWETR